MAISVLVFALTIRAVLRFIHAVTFAEHWWFPWLDGKWSGEVNSTWPIVSTMMESAQRHRAAFNPLTDAIPEDAPPAVRQIEAEIRSGLFHIEIHVTIPGTRRRSHTLFVRPVWTRPEPPRLYYLYRQQEGDLPAITDAPDHLGAAVLTYTSDRELVGEYWNQRRSDRGLNVAGTLRLARKTA